MRYSVFPRLLSVFICVHLWPLFGQQSAPSDYILGPDDVITLSVPNLDEMPGKPMRIDMRGDINLPLVGHIHAADLTAGQLESEGDDFIELAHPFDSANHHASLATLADALRQTLATRRLAEPLTRSAVAGS